MRTTTKHLRTSCTGLLLCTALLGACGGGGSDTLGVPVAAPPPANTTTPGTSAPGGSANGAGDNSATKPTILAAVTANPNTKTLVEAIKLTGMEERLSRTDGKSTLFAPVDSAWDALFTELGTTKAAWFADTARLARVLQYHLVPRDLESDEFSYNSPVTTTLAGETFVIEGASGKEADALFVDGKGRKAAVEKLDNDSVSGEIHYLKGVMLPRL